MPILKDNFSRAASLSLMERNNVQMTPEERIDVRKIDSHMRDLSLHGLIGAILFNRGLRNNFYLDSAERAQVVTDFMQDYQNVQQLVDILTEIQNRAIQEGYEQAVTNAKKICNFGVVEGFTAEDIISVSPFARLALTADKATLTNAIAMKTLENITLGTHTGYGLISRHNLYNNRMEPFITGGKQFGIAAARTVNDTVMKLLISNPQLSDSIALFHANHNNLVSSGAPIGQSPLSDGITAIMNQASGGVKLNIAPKFILVRPIEKLTAEGILTAVLGSSREDMEVLTDANFDDTTLSGYSATAWHLATDPTQMGTFMVMTLKEYPLPMAQFQAARSNEALGIFFKLIYDFGVIPEHYAGLYKNSGS